MKLYPPAGTDGTRTPRGNYERVNDCLYDVQSTHPDSEAAGYPSDVVTAVKQQKTAHRDKVVPCNTTGKEFNKQPGSTVSNAVYRPLPPRHLPSRYCTRTASRRHCATCRHVTVPELPAGDTAAPTVTLLYQNCQQATLRHLPSRYCTRTASRRHCGTCRHVTVPELPAGDTAALALQYPHNNRTSQLWRRPRPHPVPNPIPTPSLSRPNLRLLPPVPSRPVPSRLVPSRPVPSRPVPSRPVPSSPVPSRPAPPRPAQSRPRPRPRPRPVPSRPIPVPSRPTPLPSRPHPVPSRPFPSRPVPSRPVPSHPGSTDQRASPPPATYWSTHCPPCGSSG